MVTEPRREMLQQTMTKYLSSADGKDFVRKPQRIPATELHYFSCGCLVSRIHCIWKVLKTFGSSTANVNAASLISEEFIYLFFLTHLFAV